MKDFGLLLKTLRTSAGLTQQDLAKQLHITGSTISKWERSESIPDAVSIRNIAHALNISCDELLHPTDTLSKLNSATDENTLDICDDTICAENITTDFISDDVPTPKHSISTPKKILLICIPLLIFGISLGAIGLRILHYNTTTSESYELVSTRNNVDTPDGNAYEIIFYIDSELDLDELLNHSDSIAEEWSTGTYDDSTEQVLVISYYLADSNIDFWTSAYFRSTYFLESLKK